MKFISSQRAYLQKQKGTRHFWFNPYILHISPSASLNILNNIGYKHAGTLTVTQRCTAHWSCGKQSRSLAHRLWVSRTHLQVWCREGSDLYKNNKCWLLIINQRSLYQRLDKARPKEFHKYNVSFDVCHYWMLMNRYVFRRADVTIHHDVKQMTCNRIPLEFSWLMKVSSTSTITHTHE